MKEIDFLPEWYKSGKRREVSYRTQCIALGGVFLVMVVWNIITTQSISKAKAQLVQMENKKTQAENVSIKLGEIKSELGCLQEKAEIIEDIDSKIDIASVLAEISFLIDGKIVLSKLELVAEKFKDKQQDEQSPRNGTVVRAARSTFNEEHELPLGDVRFKVVIGGVAADAGNVAALICKLEESPYFCQVVPSFSRTAVITTAANPDFNLKINSESTNKNVSKDENNIQVQVSEFEISSYLANYREN